MIHWGSSIPCTLYINGQKKCDFHLPDNTSWNEFTGEVSRQFEVVPTQWYYTCPNRSFNELLRSEEEFQNVKTLCSANQVVLQLNACTETVPPAAPLQHNSNFQLAVELSVQSYLERVGLELVRELAHNNRICCCNRDQSAGGSTIAESLTDNLIHDESEIFVDARQTTHQPQSFVSADKSRKVEEMSATASSAYNADCKRPKVVLGEKEYMLACLDNTKTVIPGQKMKASWNLVTKHGTSSQWDVIEEGGTLLHVGEVLWDTSTPNISTFTSEFLAPSQEGTYDSVWSLLQDSIKRETFVFCKLIVSRSPLKGTSSLAMHGNIPADTSVAKHLNSNKVFCISARDPPHGKSANNTAAEFVVVPSATALTSSTSSDSSIEIIERSNDAAGYFLNDPDPHLHPLPQDRLQDEAVMTDRAISPQDCTNLSEQMPISPSPFQVSRRSSENVYSIVDNISQMNISPGSTPTAGNMSRSSQGIELNQPSSSRGSQLTRSLELLREMGFTDTNTNKQLLRSKSIEEVVIELSEGT